MKKFLCLISFLFLTVSFTAIRATDKPSQTSTKWYEDIFDFLITEQLGYTDVSSETETFVRNIQKELGMENQRIRIKRMSHYAEKRLMGKRNAAVASYANLMIIGEKWFKTLTEAEKRALVGHEFIHLKQNHIRKQLILSLTVLAVYYSIISKVTNPILAQIQQKLPWPYRYDNRTSIAIGYLFARYTLRPIISWYSRRCEREADTLAAQQLKCAQGGVELFKRFLNEAADPQSRFAIKRFFAKLLASHPTCEERINYLQELADAQIARDANTCINKEVARNDTSLLTA